MRFFIAPNLVAFPLLPLLATFSTARADGADTLSIKEIHYHLDSIDAPEPDQGCLDPAGVFYLSDQIALRELRRFVPERRIHCEDHGSDTSQAETSVVFDLIAARYERRSLLITANQPFGEWGKIFTDKTMTLAAIDRLVHHATIVEMNVERYRRKAALKRKHGKGD